MLLIFVGSGLQHAGLRQRHRSCLKTWAISSGDPRNRMEPYKYLPQKDLGPNHAYFCVHAEASRYTLPLVALCSYKMPTLDMHNSEGPAILSNPQSPRSCQQLADFVSQLSGLFKRCGHLIKCKLIRCNTETT